MVKCLEAGARMVTRHGSFLTSPFPLFATRLEFQLAAFALTSKPPDSSTHLTSPTLLPRPPPVARIHTHLVFTSMADLSVQTLCVMCRPPGSRVCGSCRSIKYSSEARQKSDWPIHKPICKSFRNFLATGPSPQHNNAISVSMDEDKPRLV